MYIFLKFPQVTGGLGFGPGSNSAYSNTGHWMRKNMEETYLDSTEILVAGAKKWRFSGKLPTSRWGLRGVSINNKIIIAGQCQSVPKILNWNTHNIFCLIHDIKGGNSGSSKKGTPLNEVLEFRPQSEDWRQVSRLKHARRDHAMSVLKSFDKGRCVWEECWTDKWNLFVSFTAFQENILVFYSCRNASFAIV